jgi:hypothetical protein
LTRWVVYGIHELATTEISLKLVTCLVLSAALSSALADEPKSPAVQPPVAEAKAAVGPVAATPAAAPTLATTTTPAVATTPATTTTAAIAATPAGADKVEAPKAAITDAQIKQMRERGYRPVVRNGEMVFCRSEGQIGTRFPSTRCSTMDQLKQAELTGKEYVNSIQQQGSAVPFKP